MKDEFITALELLGTREPDRKIVGVQSRRSWRGRKLREADGIPVGRQLLCTKVADQKNTTQTY